MNNPGLMPLMGLVGAPVVNRGILTLNNVISALGDHRRNVSHVPFKVFNLLENNTENHNSRTILETFPSFLFDTNTFLFLG